MKTNRIIIAILVLSLVFGWNLPRNYATSDNHGTNSDVGQRTTYPTSLNQGANSEDGHRLGTTSNVGHAGNLGTDLGSDDKQARIVTWAENFSDYAFPECCGANITYWSPFANSIWQTFDGGFLVTGSVISFPVGSHVWYTSVWIMKLAGNGHILWQRSYASGTSYHDGPQNEEALSATPTRDHGAVVVARTNSVECGGGVCPWVFKIDQNGHMLWQKIYRMNVTEARATSIKETPDHGVVLAGTAVLLAQDGSGPTIWVMKTSPTGDLLWMRTYGRLDLEGAGATAPIILSAPHDGYLMGVRTCCPSAHAFVGAFALLRLDHQGNILWQTGYVGDLASLTSTSDGGYVLSGGTYVGNNVYGGWVAKLGSTGNIRWEHLYLSGFPSSIQQTTDGGYVLAGSRPAQSLDTSSWLSKFDSNGKLVWQKSFTQAKSLWQAFQTSDQGFLALGIDHSKPAILKLDSTGRCCAKITESPNVSVAKVTTRSSVSEMVSSQPDFQTSVRETHSIVTSTHGLASIVCSSITVTGQDFSEEDSQTDSND